MGYVPFVVVIAGFVTMVLLLNYHTFKNYKTLILNLIQKIQETKQQVRADVDQLEFLSVPELEAICENMCSHLTGKLDSKDLEQKMQQVNEVFGRMYSGSESKHIQEEILNSLNLKIDTLSGLNKQLKATQYSYEKLLVEKPYSAMARLMHFSAIQIPWEKPNAAAIPA